jgi:hypothetical protein
VLGLHEEAVRESWWHPHHPQVIGRQDGGHVPAECRRALPEIDRDVEYFPDHYPYEFALRVLDLVVESPENVTNGSGVILLHEIDIDAQPGEAPFAEAFKKEAPLIQEYLRFQTDNIWNFRPHRPH